MTQTTRPLERDLLRGLDARQRRAVTHGEGPLLVVAGAGTGKTRVITRRIAWLIATKRARPSEILALTFTDRAADEMQARVDELVPYGYVDTVISTFHAFGDRLLREFAFELGLPSDPRVVGRADAVILLRDRLFELPLGRYRPLGDPTRFLDALVATFGRAKDGGWTPDGLLARAEGMSKTAAGDAEAAEAERLREVAVAFAAYQRVLAETGSIDFGDQVALPLRLLRQDPAVRSRVQRRFRYILVDEFQDTNPAQVELVSLVAGEARNVTVVGDDDQSIYAFRGAALANILGFRDRFPDAAEVVLRRNYRSRSPILVASYRLVRHNDPARLEVRHGIDKRLVAVRRSRRPAPVREFAFATVADEADWVARDVAARLTAGTAPRALAILVRSNADAEPFLASLDLAGVPRRFSGTSGLYGRPEVRRLLALLRLVADPDSTVDAYALAAAPPYDVPGLDLARLLDAARRSHRSLWSVLVDAAGGSDGQPLAPATREAIAALVGDLGAAVEQSASRPAGEVLYGHLKRTGVLARLARASTPAEERELANVARFFDVVRRTSALLRDPRAAFLAPHLQALVEAGDDPQDAGFPDDSDAVSVLTVHKAKGLEFPVVYLVGLVDGRFPARGRRDSLELPSMLLGGPVPDAPDDDVAEERRLFYVAMTRARDELIMTHAVDTGGRRARRRSPFVAEALDLPVGAASRPSAAGPLDRIPGLVPAEAVPAMPGARREGSGGTALSFSELDEYLGCPARYRFHHVLRLPVPAHHALSYGNAMHEAVAAFGRSQAAGAPLTADALIAVFEAAWTGEGFLSRAHEEARLAAGRLALSRFREAALTSPSRPAAIEQGFIVDLGEVRVRGRIDRVDREPDGVVLTDFKSSDVRDPQRARLRARESLQLAVYALAHQAREGRPPEHLQLVFLDSGVTGRIPVDLERLESARRRMAEAAAGIRAARFEPAPDMVGCGFCPFRELCDARAA